MSTSKGQKKLGMGGRTRKIMGAGSSAETGRTPIRPIRNPNKEFVKDLPEFTDSIIDNSEKQLDVVSDQLAGFKQRMKNETNRFEYAVDAGFWIGLCFKSSEDLGAFIDEIVPINMYRGHIDGYELAKKMGLKPNWVHGPEYKR